MTESCDSGGTPIQEPTRKIYIVLTQTGTILSRLLKLVTRAPYNHSSLALTNDLQTMYSFGRLHAYNPFRGGFVQESPAWGTFKRFQKTICLVLETEVSAQAYAEAERQLQCMLEHRKRYHYNYWGLFVAAFGRYVQREDYFYCSEFVRWMLERMKAPGIENVPDIVEPIHFAERMPHKVIYTGRLHDYTPPITE